MRFKGIGNLDFAYWRADGRDADTIAVQRRPDLGQFVIVQSQHILIPDAAQFQIAYLELRKSVELDGQLRGNLVGESAQREHGSFLRVALLDDGTPSCYDGVAGR